MKANSHHRRSNKVEFEFESYYFIHLFSISLEVPSVAKDDKSVDARLRLPRTKTSGFNLNFSYSCDVRRGEGGFQVVNRFLVRYEDAKQSKS